MNPLKLKLVEELMHHLGGSQGREFKGMLDASKMPKEGSPLEEALESPKEEALEDGKPKGISVEKVSIMGKPAKAAHMMGGDEKMAPPAEMTPKDGGQAEDEMSDDELRELLSKLGG